MANGGEGCRGRKQARRTVPKRRAVRTRRPADNPSFAFPEPSPVRHSSPETALFPGTELSESDPNQGRCVAATMAPEDAVQIQSNIT